MKKTEILIVKMDPDTKSELKRQAKKSHTSIAEYVRQLIWKQYKHSPAVLIDGELY